MRLQHWVVWGASGPCGDLVQPEGSVPLVGQGDEARPCCVVEGRNLIEAMQRYYDHQGWGTYKPMLQADGTPYPEDVEER